jgi:hypothetical protein
MKIKAPGVKNRPGEKWAQFDEKYLLSNYGRWYSLRHKKVIKQFKNNVGYMRASLTIENKKKQVFTHIKVVELFGDKFGNKLPHGVSTLREVGLSIDHVNRNKRNNTIFNLEIVTHQENCIRKFI